MVPFHIINIGTLSMNKFWGEIQRVRSATATCTVLVADRVRLLVDPSPQPELLEPLLLARRGLRPADIDLVFVTHFHGDHRFGLDLFAGVPWLMASAGLAEWRERGGEDADQIARFQPAEGRLPPGVDLYPTPGHTLGHHSLIVDTKWGKLVVAGDAVMTEDHLAAEEGHHNSIDFVQASETIRRIKRDAALVIPGHSNLIVNMGPSA